MTTACLSSKPQAVGHLETHAPIPMTEANTCHLCHKPLPKGQSFYEGRGLKVCLGCYRTQVPCKKCGFPGPLTNHPKWGLICTFCLKENPITEQGVCLVCNKPILEGQSHYADHGQMVCQDCFAKAKTRCFTCRFPKVDGVLPGQGGVCDHCLETLITKLDDHPAILSPLFPFLEAHGYLPQGPLNLNFIDWRMILGMQRKDSPDFSVQFLDELVHWAYPAYHLAGKIYALPGLPSEWFIPIVSGQLAARELCKAHKIPHLGELGPFYGLARGWVHYLSYAIAKRLKYEGVAKKLSRWPEAYAGPEFNKFLAVEENRGPKGVISFAKTELERFALRYLKAQNKV